MGSAGPVALAGALASGLLLGFGHCAAMCGPLVGSLARLLLLLTPGMALVAIGLVAAVRLSQTLGLLDNPAGRRIEIVLTAHALPVRLAEPLALAALMAALARDKKVRAGTPRFVVLPRLGEAVTCNGVAPAAVEAVFRDIGAV